MWNMREHSGPEDPAIPWINVPREHMEVSKIIKAYAGRRGVSLYSFSGPIMHQKVAKSHQSYHNRPRTGCPQVSTTFPSH